MKKLLKEPLVHFLALGAVLFGIGILRGEGDSPATNRIAITPGVVERLLEGFRLTWRRPPTQDEFRGLVEDYLKEEVLYREALAMGLDRDDQITRRRMRQKLEFLTADIVESIEPTDEDLLAYLHAHPDSMTAHDSEGRYLDGGHRGQCRWLLHRQVRPRGAGRQGVQLDIDHAGKELQRPVAPVRPAAAVVRQDLEAG